VNASSINPPSQPWSCALSQSTNCCSDNDNKLPDFNAHLDSNEPIVENAQHEPHWPWFFTALTTFLSLQSKLLGTSVTLYVNNTFFFLLDSPTNPPYFEIKSPNETSANSLICNLKSSPKSLFLVLVSATNLWFSLKAYALIHSVSCP